MDIKLEYRPCECARYKAAAGEPDRGADAPEFFDYAKAAAFRLREHLDARRVPRVHHQGIHVSAATIAGVRYAEPA